jgi:hypothetical protein
MHDRKNIFELWKENGEKLPMKVIIDSWNPNEHYALVERIEIGKWPYGKAHGQYFFHGKPGEIGQIRNAGTYRWILKE